MLKYLFHNRKKLSPVELQQQQMRLNFTLMDKIGIYLKNLREKENLTQEFIAEKIHVSAATVCRMENQPENFNMKNLGVYLEYFGKSFDDYFFFKQSAGSSSCQDKLLKTFLMIGVDFARELTSEAKEHIINCLNVK